MKVVHGDRKVAQRSLSTDPLAADLSSWSPYSFVLNNPVMFIDPDGRFPWAFHFRSFISSPTTGGGMFRGDGRGASTAPPSEVTSRVRSSFTIDPTARTASNPVTVSDATVFYGAGPNLPPAVARGNPESSLETLMLGGGTSTFLFEHSGKDPLTPQAATPALDLNALLSLTEDVENGVLSITGTVSGDVFPSSEAFIEDANGVKIFLGAQKESGGIQDLFGDNDKNLFKVGMDVLFDKEGGATGVRHDGTDYSIGDWNKMVEDGF